MGASNTVYTVFSFIGFILSVIPLYWHLESWNVGTCMYMIWTALGCLMYFVNSIVWDGNAINWAPVWCDISSRFILGLSCAIPAASLCINRRLYHIASPSTVTITQKDKRRRVIVDLGICLGIPVLQMILQYIVSGHRFDIFEDIGCYPTTWNTHLSFVLVYAWPLAIGCVSAVYCTLTIRAFMKRRKQFRDLISVNKNLSYSRYFRLMGLAAIDMCATIPLASYVIYLNATVAGGPFPWVSWADTHWGYSRVFQFPRIQYSQNYTMLVSLELSRWNIVFCAILFFGFFGFADEAKKHYRLALSSVAKRVGYTSFSESTGSASTDSFPSKPGMGSRGLPVYVTKRMGTKRDSMLSFSDKMSTSISATEFDDVKIQPYSPTSSSSGSSSSLPSSPTLETEIRIPEPAVDIASVRKPSVPDAPKSVGPDSGLDVV